MNCTRCGKWAGAYAGFPSDHDLCVCPKPKKEWQSLTDEEMFAALMQVDPLTKRLAPGFEYFARAIEAKLREKNG